MTWYSIARALCWIRKKRILGNALEISVGLFLSAAELTIYPRRGGARFGITISWWPDLQATRDGLGAIGCYPADTHCFKHFWGYTKLRGNRKALIRKHLAAAMALEAERPSDPTNGCHE